MAVDGPIFIFSSLEPTRLEIHATVAAAVEHLAQRHQGDQRFLQNLLCFDGLARPVDVRQSGDRFHLAVSEQRSEPWVVQGRVLRAFAQVIAFLRRGDQQDLVAIPRGDQRRELSKAVLLEAAEKASSSLSLARNYPEFATRAADLCSGEPDDDDYDGWLCCLLQRCC